eukprot:scaffold25_cov342-Pavlova_lutheri.AAC.75
MDQNFLAGVQLGHTEPPGQETGGASIQEQRDGGYPARQEQHALAIQARKVRVRFFPIAIGFLRCEAQNQGEGQGQGSPQSSPPNDQSLPPVQRRAQTIQDGDGAGDDYPPHDHDQTIHHEQVTPIPPHYVALGRFDDDDPRQDEDDGVGKELHGVPEVLHGIPGLAGDGGPGHEAEQHATSDDRQQSVGVKIDLGRKE